MKEREKIQKNKDREKYTPELFTEHYRENLDKDKLQFLSPEQSAAILSRVEENLLHYYRENFLDKTEKNKKKIEENSPAGRWIPLFSWSLGVAVAGFLLFLFFRNEPLPEIQYRGELKVIEQSRERRSESFKISVVPGKTAKLIEPKLWTIESTGGRFSFKRNYNRVYRLSLNRGAVTVDIQRGKVREFSISHQGFKVVVRGTIFSVTAGDSWTNVEVWRGKVALFYKGRQLRDLSKGQGLFFEGGKLSDVYRLPPWSYSRYPGQRLQWMFKNQPDFVHRYFLRLVRTDAYSRAQLKNWLSKLAFWEREKGKLTDVMETLKVLSSLGGEGRDLALYDALKLCRRLFPNSMNCSRLYRKFLRNYPNSYWKKYVEFYLGEALLNSRRGGERERGAELIREYLERYPGDLYSGRALKLFISYWRGRGYSCSNIGGKIRLSGVLRDKFRAFCSD